MSLSQQTGNVYVNKTLTNGAYVLIVKAKDNPLNPQDSKEVGHVETIENSTRFKTKYYPVKFNPVSPNTFTNAYVRNYQPAIKEMVLRRYEQGTTHNQ